MTYVLAEGGVGKYAEEGRKGRTEAVTHNAAGQFLICGFPSHTAFRDTGDVTYGLNCRYDEHDSNRDNGAGVKHQLYRHQLRNGKPAGFGNLIPV